MYTHTHTPPAGKMRKVLLLDTAMQQLASQLKDIQSMLFFARGANYATALEAALKVGGVWWVGVQVVALGVIGTETCASLGRCGAVAAAKLRHCRV
jgi:hypothetical protein